MILDGKVVAKTIKSKVKYAVSDIAKAKNIVPHLVVIQVGDDPASSVYISGKQADCAEVGIKFTWKHLKADTTEIELKQLISRLNKSQTVTAILVQLPLPKKINPNILDSISPKKDADGLNPENIAALYKGKSGIIPCTPKGIIEILKYYDLPIVGKKAVIVGRSQIVGKPLALALLNENATVSICHSKTKNLSEETKTADILIAAIGQANFIKKEMIKKDVILIDVGINRVDGKLCGDIDFNDCKDNCMAITKVPGGIGLMTRAALLENVFELFLKNNAGKKI
ncbi:MAG: bifunctional 5,10-methylenetetrahydrofolate dehydrogenase/5,10-methenyltetrahydrofolate cyclohydrolase [Erysipelotrichales bacterium]|nr:bifunctional 5,10-methylenetetrahydrofolate dehydrogenase/5,10-methenyltetrahydrofolate cyclohydrolase [Erysipelotrichales bacterium]